MLELRSSFMRLVQTPARQYVLEIRGHERDRFTCGYSSHAAPRPCYPEVRDGVDQVALRVRRRDASGAESGRSIEVVDLANAPPSFLSTTTEGDRTLLQKTSKHQMFADATAWLCVEYGSHPPLHVSMAPAEVLRVGRASDGDVILGVPSTSRAHALVLRSEISGQWCVVDIGSRSGTHLCELLTQLHRPASRTHKRGDCFFLTEDDLFGRDVERRRRVIASPLCARAHDPFGHEHTPRLQLGKCLLSVRVASPISEPLHDFHAAFGVMRARLQQPACDVVVCAGSWVEVHEMMRHWPERGVEQVWPYFQRTPHYAELHRIHGVLESTMLAPVSP